MRSPVDWTTCDLLEPSDHHQDAARRRSAPLARATTCSRLSRHDHVGDGQEIAVLAEPLGDPVGLEFRHVLEHDRVNAGAELRGRPAEHLDRDSRWETCSGSSCRRSPRLCLPARACSARSASRMRSPERARHARRRRACRRAASPADISRTAAASQISSALRSSPSVTCAARCGMPRALRQLFDGAARGARQDAPRIRRRAHLAVDHDVHGRRRRFRQLAVAQQDGLARVRVHRELPQQHVREQRHGLDVAARPARVDAP